MTHYSDQPRDQTFVKGYGFLSFAKNMGRNIGKNISNKLSKYIQKLLDHIKQSPTDVRKTASKRAIQEKAESTGHLIGTKIADEITRGSKTLPQNNLETNEEMLREKYISPELRQKIMDDLIKINITMIIWYNIVMKYKKIMNFLNDAMNQPSKFKTKNWIEINDE